MFMWIKAGVLGGMGIIFSNSAVWIMAGLGIKIAFQSSHKWVDFCNKNRGDNGIDRLPDDILCNIVSRLIIIEASRTSILSKRWRKIWTRNHVINFSCLYTIDNLKRYHDNIAYGDRQRFFKAVNQSLHLYSGYKLKVFFMHCCFLNGNTCHLVKWMQALGGLDVVEIYLGNSCETWNGDPLDRSFTFSFKLIDGLSRLKYLNLRYCYVDTSFVGQCNTLIRLDLLGVPLLSHRLSVILLSCPNLIDLSMECCELPLKLIISGPNLKLRYLRIFDCSNVQKLEISDLNVMTIMIDIRHEVEILLSSIPKLIRLHHRTNGKNYCFGDVSMDLPQLKYLLVQTSYQILRLPPNFKVFGNVRELCFMTRGGYPCPEAYEKVDLCNFAQVLVACPFLEEFYLVIGSPVCKEETRAQWPVLQHQNLVIMELSGFSNTQNELEFAKFILKSAQVLKCLRLHFSSRRYNNKDYYFVAEKDLKRIDRQAAQVICDKLGRHVVSKYADVHVYN